MAGKSHIVIIGAGVTGLTTAVFLAEECYKVTIVAAHVPGDSSIEYTSPWAGAHWHTHATRDNPVECDWDIQTYDYWLEILQNEKKDPQLPRSGLKLMTAYKYWDFPTTTDIWWSPYVKDFEEVNASREPIKSINKRAREGEPMIVDAMMQKEFAINVPQYLLYLQERARKAGAEVIQQRLPIESGLNNAMEAAEGHAVAAGRGNADCFVNASGLGAGKLCGDQAMYPIRGQTVLVKGEAVNPYTRSGKDYGSYCIVRPGSGTSILGGTREADVWDETPDPAVTQRIIKYAAMNVPELLTGPDGGFEVVSVQCGLRPGRKGGPRIGIEALDGYKIVHAYGHAGGGYQNSIGSARLVSKLVQESLSSSTQAVAKL
ncbi:hypothetical protein LTR78_003940 [Recurvomyces mirabilis]|uniref:FAD dependent oxidoreductase domain-containing protein n=1 Tax=Recurvomyces mirabilis TaxID=574656 RepID=A0AAE0WQM0_9PEZI|nr:hypothetical protein LTR78_003940 [Recurvomyces mirabilis]KAK5153922.1 hypothetical protein LTS14_007142 [Recurvomyces mirabilis]